MTRTFLTALSVVALLAGARVSAAEKPTRVIVRLDVPATPAAIARAQDAALAALGDLAQSPRRFATLPGFAVTTTAEGLARLSALAIVRAIEPDHLLTPQLIDTPSLVNADVLWGQGTEGAGWSVAILDTGVEKAHAFLDGRVTSEACYSTTDSALGATSLCPGGVAESTAVGSGVNCVGLTGCEHGTAVAGVAAGGHAGSIINGIARGANIISIQVFSRAQGPGICGAAYGPCLKTFTSDIIRALEHVLALAGPTNAGRIGAVNLSVGSDITLSLAALDTGACDSTDGLFTQAVENLRAAGIPTVVSAGNGSSSTQLQFPACVSRTISVGAVTKADGFVTSNRNAMLSLVAPGEGIRTSTIASGLLTDQFAVYSGSSLAAAVVSGGWTLLKSRAPDASIETVLQALRQTSVGVGDPVTGLVYPRVRLHLAAGSLGPAGSPTSVTVAVLGTTVTAGWGFPFDGTIPFGYHVEVRSATSGAIVGIVNVGSQTSFVTTLQPGNYLLRVRSVTAGGPAAASNDVPFTVGILGTTRAPLTPRDLRAEVRGQNVFLSWNLPLESPAASSYVLDVGSLPGLNNLGSFDTGSNAVGFTALNVNPGIFFVRIRARNAFGLSGYSNEIPVTVVATNCAVPLPPTNLNATVLGSLVTLNWTPPVVVGTVSGYVLEVGSGPGLSDILRSTTGPSTLLTTGVPPGIFYVRVRAQSTCGLTGPSNEIAVEIQ